LRIYRDIALPAFERVGDTREIAITWGRIADIAHKRGAYDEEIALRSKELEVHQRTGDLDGIAGCTWELAGIDLAREDYKSAIPKLIESFQINGQLQRADGIATVGWTLGQLLIASGATEQARQVLGASLAAARKIGWTDLAQEIAAFLNAHPQAEES
jgi:tetratricopeptide (TPR) repeat protein